MKRSRILQLLAKRLGRREVDEIRSLALAEMAFVQEAILERLPVQPNALETDLLLAVLEGETKVSLPSNYNGLMTHGGVWIAPGRVSALRYLTSKLYIVETGDSITAKEADTSADSFRTVLKKQNPEEEVVAVAPSISEASLRNIVRTYSYGPEDLQAEVPDITEVSLRTILKDTSISDDLEALAPSISGASLKEIRVFYEAETDTVTAVAPSISEVTLNVNV